MDFQKYVELTRETAVYPDEYERDYVIHGLVDELGELYSTVEDPSGLIQDDYMSSKHVKKIEQEMGDVAWYIARIIDHFEFYDFEKLWNTESGKVKLDPERGKNLVQSSILHAAQINGHQKKSVRDDDNRESQIQEELRKILVNIQKATHHLGVRDFNVVTRRNIEKLFDRKARDVLHGDGDNR
jgi:NTP pyrophosphatase (non-canonical NTP hydrolase)